VLGLTFKENVPDIRNSKVIDIVRELREYEVEVLVTDPWADAEEARHEYGLELVDVETVGKVDAVVWAVAHDQFRERFTPAALKQLCCSEDCGVVVDVKSVLDRSAIEAQGLKYWCL